MCSPGGLVVKNLPANAEDTGDVGLIPELGRSLGGGNGNPLQDSCLKNPMDRDARGATVQSLKESDTTEHSTAQQQKNKLLIKRQFSDLKNFWGGKNILYNTEIEYL